MAVEIDKLQYLKIGVQGENDAMDIEIDMTAWVEELDARGYTTPCFHLLFKPYGASDASIMTTEFDRDTNILTWTITLDATLVPGQGYTEIRALNHPDDGLLKKSRVIPTLVEDSLTNYIEGGTVPSPYEDWVNTLLEARDQLANVLGGAETEYTISTSTATIPVSGWSQNIPDLTQAKGQYLWSRLRYDWGVTTGSQDHNYTYTYTISYIGLDGDGSVTSVNGQSGNVTLRSTDIPMSSSDDTRLNATIDALNTAIGTKLDTSKIIFYSGNDEPTGVAGAIWLKPKT